MGFTSFADLTGRSTGQQGFVLPPASFGVGMHVRLSILFTASRTLGAYERTARTHR